MDVYVVLDGPLLVGVSAKLQGAELLRQGWASKLASQRHTEGVSSSEDHAWRDLFEEIYARQQIVNTELQDAE